MSRGYLCYKGLYADEMQNHPGRLLQTVKRQPDGSYRPIDTEVALDEIAERMADLMADHGKDAIALYTGGSSYLTSTAWMMLPMFRKALGTNANYSTATIDLHEVSKARTWSAAYKTSQATGIENPR